MIMWFKVCIMYFFAMALCGLSSISETVCAHSHISGMYADLQPKRKLYWIPALKYSCITSAIETLIIVIVFSFHGENIWLPTLIYFSSMIVPVMFYNIDYSKYEAKNNNNGNNCHNNYDNNSTKKDI